MSADGPADTFRLAGPDIVSETFDDGETVVVNLQNGFYFSLNPAGGLVFTLLTSGASVGEIAAFLAERYEADGGSLEDLVGEYALCLVGEGLISFGAPDVAVPLPNGDAPTGATHERLPLESPTVTAYTDMQDLLLADPIHDYDDTGWPARSDDR